MLEYLSKPNKVPKPSCTKTLNYTILYRVLEVKSLGKVSIYIDDELWQKFKKMVVQRTGDTRSLSKEVQSLIEETIVEKALLGTFKKLGLNLEKLPSFGDVKAVVTVKPTSSGRMVREMRDERAESVSR